MKTIILAAVALLLSGCTAAQRSTASEVAKDVGDFAPLVCTVLTAVGQPQAGTACGSAVGDVSAVSKLIQSILDSLPPAPGMSGPAGAPEGFTYKGVTVVMSPVLASRVKAKLQVKAQ